MSQAHNIGWCVAFVVSAGASLVWPGRLTPALLPVECGMAAYYGWRAWKGESRG